MPKIISSRTTYSPRSLRGLLSIAERLARLAFTRPRFVALQVEHRLCVLAAGNGLLLIRMSMGIVFLWFGALKFLPGTTPIDALAEQTITMITFHVIPPLVCLHILAVWECVIGIGLLFGVYLRAALGLLFMHLPGTFLPLVLLPHVAWTHFPFSPSFVGHYILKNFILVAAAIIIAASSRGGRIIVNPKIARMAKRLELVEQERSLLKAEAAATEEIPPSQNSILICFSTAKPKNLLNISAPPILVNTLSENAQARSISLR